MSACNSFIFKITVYMEHESTTSVPRTTFAGSRMWPSAKFSLFTHHQIILGELQDFPNLKSIHSRGSPFTVGWLPSCVSIIHPYVDSHLLRHALLWYQQDPPHITDRIASIKSLLQKPPARLPSFRYKGGQRIVAARIRILLAQTWHESTQQFLGHMMLEGKFLLQSQPQTPAQTDWKPAHIQGVQFLTLHVFTHCLPLFFTQPAHQMQWTCSGFSSRKARIW